MHLLEYLLTRCCRLCSGGRLRAIAGLTEFEALKEYAPPFLDLLRVLEKSLVHFVNIFGMGVKNVTIILHVWCLTVELCVTASILDLRLSGYPSKIFGVQRYINAYSDQASRYTLVDDRSHETQEMLLVFQANKELSASLLFIAGSFFIEKKDLPLPSV